MNTQEWIENQLEEAWKMPARINKGVDMLTGELQADVKPTPYEVVGEWGRVRLLYYAPVGEVVDAPILMVPSIINRYYVLDLRPGASLVEHLVNRGIPVYMLDWGTPGPQDRYATLEQHILKWLHAAVRRTCKHADVPRVHMLGYCIGGTFATVYAALRPERIASLIALTAPIDFHDPGTLSLWAQNEGFPVEKLAEHMGMINADFLQSGFSLLKPLSNIQKWRGFLDNCWNEKYLKGFLPMEEWVTDNVDVPGPTYQTLIEDWYRGNKLVEGTFELAGEPVRLEEIDCPVMAAISGKDHIVPDPAARCLVDFVTSGDREVFECAGGHIGAVVGRAARTQLWPAVENWLRERPVSEQERIDG